MTTGHTCRLRSIALKSNLFLLNKSIPFVKQKEPNFVNNAA